MELNRNHYFIFGFLLLFFGAQLRMFDAFVLTEPASRIVRRNESPTPRLTSWNPFAPGGSTMHPERTIVPPKWVGWFLLSVGSVLVLQSLAMRKPGG